MRVDYIDFYIGECKVPSAQSCELLHIVCSSQRHNSLILLSVYKTLEIQQTDDETLILGYRPVESSHSVGAQKHYGRPK